MDVMRKNVGVTLIFLSAAVFVGCVSSRISEAPHTDPQLQIPTPLTSTHSSTVLVPPDIDGVLASLLGSAKRSDIFFTRNFGSDIVHVNRSLAELPLPAAASGLGTMESLFNSPSQFSLRNWSSLDLVDKASMTYQDFDEYIQLGGSATAEIVNQDNPLLPFKQQLEHALGLPLSFNVYHSGPSGSALKPHTDRYDVFVLQLRGVKEWILCVPKTTILGVVNEADAASLAEVLIKRDRKERPACGEESTLRCCLEEDIFRRYRHGLSCQNITLYPGDFMYMPKGVVHAATTHRDTNASTHCAIGLKRDRFTYSELLDTALKFLAQTTTSSSIVSEVLEVLQTRANRMKDSFYSSDHQGTSETVQTGLGLNRLMPAWIWRYYESCHPIYCNTTRKPPLKCSGEKFGMSEAFLLLSLETMLDNLQLESSRHLYHETKIRDHWLVELGILESIARLRQPDALLNVLNEHLERIQFEALDKEEQNLQERAEHLNEKAEQLLEQLMKQMGGGVSESLKRHLPRN